MQPEKTVDCFADQEHTVPLKGSEPNTFYLITSAQEHRLYILAAQRGAFEMSMISSERYQIRVMRLNEIWAEVGRESEEVRGALMDLWTRDLLNPFMTAQFRWQGRDGRELLGSRSHVRNDTVVLHVPPSWGGGELVFQIGDNQLKWAIEAAATGKAGLPGIGETGKEKDRTEWYLLAFVVLVLLVCIILLARELLHPR